MSDEAYSKFLASPEAEAVKGFCKPFPDTMECVKQKWRDAGYRWAEKNDPDAFLEMQCYAIKERLKNFPDHIVESKVNEFRRKHGLEPERLNVTDEKRKEERARVIEFLKNVASKESFHNFLTKANDIQIEVAKEILEGLKRGFLPGYYNEWLLGLSPEERARRGLENEYFKVETRYLESKIPKYKCNYIGPGKEEMCDKFEEAYRKRELNRLRRERREQGL